MERNPIASSMGLVMIIAVCRIEFKMKVQLNLPQCIVIGFLSTQMSAFQCKYWSHKKYEVRRGCVKTQSWPAPMLRIRVE